MVRMFRSVACAFLLLAVTGGSLRAQWRQIAYHLYSATPSGAICFKDGLLWIGNDRFNMSADTGKTWTSFPLPDPALNGIVYDLRFFDRSTGLAACPGGTYRTTDQGVTWTLIKAGIPYSVAFGVTSQIIATAEDAPFGFNISTDGGATWNHNQFGQTGFKILGLRNGWFEAYSGIPSSPQFLNLPHGGHVYVTTDYGVTWVKRKGNNPNFDCWDFDIDSCDLSRLYLADVNDASGTDSLSNFYVSSDSGDSWVVREPQISPFFTGALAVTKHAVFAQSRAKGVFRSTDLGTNWKPIGGPNCDPNTRMLSAINDNACNDFGSVYRTNNSGGDSIWSTFSQSYATDPPKILQFDSLFSCSNAEPDTLRFLPQCSPSPVVKAHIFGKDSINFSLADSMNLNPLVVLFTAGSSTNYSSALQIELSDGSLDTLQLLGFGKPSPQIVLAAPNQFNDTIGGDIYLPVRISNAIEQGDLDFTVHFDTSMLLYGGSYSNGGTNDLTNWTQSGRVRVHIPAASIDWTNPKLPAGQIVFRVFPRFDSCTTVTIDSVNILVRGISCQQTITPFTAQICSNLGCGTVQISDFLRYKHIAPFSIQPNPSKGMVTIMSKENIGAVRICLRDERGIARFETFSILQAGSSSVLDFTKISSGSYWITISNESYNETQKLLIVH
jgi:photosystem II stability/assembly factor-like uncharacterized protein